MFALQNQKDGARLPLKCWLLGAVAAGAMIPNFACAQAASSPQSSVPREQSTSSQQKASTPQTVEEITVTAQYRKQNLQRTPVAITALSSSTLESRGQVSVADITNEAPNVVLKPAPASYGPSLQSYIRGVGQYDFNFALEPGVGMYVDDVYYSTLAGSIFDLLDLDRVEVLRGPQGTLAGMNSIGGAVKLYSAAPNGSNGGYVQGTYGSFSRTEFRGSADYSLVPDQLAVRISGVSKNQDGYVTRYDYACTHPGANVPSYVVSNSCKLGTEGGKSYTGERVSLRWTPMDKLTVDVVGDNTNDNSEASPITLIYVGHTTGGGGPGTTSNSYPRWTSAPAGGVNLWDSATQTSPFISYSALGQAGDTYSHSPYVNYATYGDAAPPDGTSPFQVPPIMHVNSYGGSAAVSYQLTDEINIKSITAYRRYSAEWTLDEDGSPLSDEVLSNTVWHRQFSQELRLTGSLFDDAVNWVVGGFYFDQKSHYGGRIDLGSFDFIEDDIIPATNKAGFVNVGWKMTDKLEINVGGRYTTEEKTFEFGRGGVPGNTYPACAAAGGAHVAPQVCSINGTTGSFSGDNWDYRAAVQYQWTPNFMTYVDVSTGFKGGGVNPRPFYPAQEVPFSPETMTAYEGGIKSEWFDNRLRLNLAGFYNLYRSIQLTVNNCSFVPGIAAGQVSPCAAPLNAGNADVSGVELEAEAHPIEGLSIDGSASYLNFAYSYVSAFATAAGITSSMTTPFAPKVKYNLGVQYEMRMGEFGSITPRLDYSYQSSFYSSAINYFTNHVSGYGLLNLHVKWQPVDEMWQLTVEATNLTDKLYYLGYFDNRSSSQTVQAEPAPPREWAVTIKRKF